MLGETSKLIAYEGTNSVAIDFVDGGGPLKYAVRLGQRWPLHATGGGKLYLAHYEDETVREMLAELGLEQITDETIVDVEALLVEVAEHPGIDDAAIGIGFGVAIEAPDADRLLHDVQRAAGVGGAFLDGGRQLQPAHLAGVQAPVGGGMEDVLVDLAGVARELL